MAFAAQKTNEDGLSEQMKEARLKVDPEVLDLTHLAQYTSGDAALELELFGLFKLQANLQLENIGSADDECDWEMAVHSLKGSARGIGAGKVAELAADLEKIGFSGCQNEKRITTTRLGQATAKCVAAIESLLIAA